MAEKQLSEVVIAGAGMVGLSFALQLAKANIKVLLLDPILYKPRENFSDYDIRVSHLIPFSVDYFKEMDVWNDMFSLRVSPFNRIEVWQETSDKRLTFDASEVYQKSLGVVVENSVIQNALFKAMTQHSNIIYKPSNTIERLETKDEFLRLHLVSGETCDTKLLVGADGAFSKIRELGGFEWQEKSYEQHALVATIHTSIAHSKIARQRFLHSGPLAFLPLLDENYCSIVWSHTETCAKELMLMPEVEFNTALQGAFGSELGELRVVSERKCFPLVRRKLSQYVHSRIALIGDAAHTVHPLAGQGLNMGLADAKALSDIILDSLNQNRDIGFLYTLRKYERKRKSENLLLMTVIDAFDSIFRKPGFSAAFLRQIGFGITDHCLPLKKFIIARAMGYE